VVLRQLWVVLPKTLLYQLFLVAALLGAGVSLTAYGIVVNDRRTLWGFPVALVIAKLQNMLVPWGKRATQELRDYLALPKS
jgi:hypothetical protein